MRYPSLVPARLCKTEISLAFEQEGISKYGEPLEPVTYTGTCNYQDKGKVIVTDDKRTVLVAGCALFPGDICPSLPVISGGKATVFGVERRIIEGRKARNPDGTVNYTEVILE